MIQDFVGSLLDIADKKKQRKRLVVYDPAALTVMVTLTGSLSSPGAGWAWPPVLVALGGGMVRGEDALGMAMAGPVSESSSVDQRQEQTRSD